MKNKLLNIILLTLSISSAMAQEHGGATGVGGGGDATEMRVDDIRHDLLSWIKKGGARALSLPERLTHDKYEKEMKKILAPQKVTVSFTPEKIFVHGVYKTCESWQDSATQKFFMTCNIARFEGTSESDQYRLIHHEYAGLAGIEHNNGGASDYEISNQITDFLEPTTVLRLAVRAPRLGHIDLNYPCRSILEADYIQREKKTIRQGKVSSGLFCTIVGLPVSLGLTAAADKNDELFRRTMILMDALSSAKYSDNEVRDYNRMAHEEKIKLCTSQQRAKNLLVNPKECVTGSNSGLRSLTSLLEHKIPDYEITTDAVRAYLIRHRESDHFCKDGIAPKLNSEYLTKMAEEIKLGL